MSKRKSNSGSTAGQKRAKQRNQPQQLADYLLRAVRLRDLQQVRHVIIDEGLSMDTADKYVEEALMTACVRGYIEIVQFLVEQGADVNLENRHGFTPFFFACYHNHVALMRLLLEAGTHFNEAKMPLEETPLHLACRLGRSEAAEMLLEMGADVNKVDIDGYTPLLSACLNDMPNVVKMLLEAGADVDTVDDLGRVPFTVACERGHEEVVEVLFDHYMQVNE